MCFWSIPLTPSLFSSLNGFLCVGRWLVCGQRNYRFGPPKCDVVLVWWDPRIRFLPLSFSLLSSSNGFNVTVVSRFGSKFVYGKTTEILVDVSKPREEPGCREFRPPSQKILSFYLQVQNEGGSYFPDWTVTRGLHPMDIMKEKCSFLWPWSLLFTVIPVAIVLVETSSENISLNNDI